MNHGRSLAGVRLARPFCHPSGNGCIGGFAHVPPNAGDAIGAPFKFDLRQPAIELHFIAGHKACGFSDLFAA